MALRSIAALALVVVVGLVPSVSPASVKTLSTDGEATVYLQDDFSGSFDIIYNVVFDPAPRNKSWSSVSINLLGSMTPSGAVAVGLTHGYPKADSLRAFTLSNLPNQRSQYQSFAVQRGTEWQVELRGDSRAYYALVDGHHVGKWSRVSMQVPRSYVQINGEVSAVGDEISVRVVPVHLIANGHTISFPFCAFTTQGVEVQAVGLNGAIEFSGARRLQARVTYVSLINGATADSCTQLKGAPSADPMQ